MLEQLAHVCYRFRWPVLATWAIALLLVLSLAIAAGGRFTGGGPRSPLPGADSQNATDLLEHRFPKQAGDTATLVFKAELGVTDNQIRQRVSRLLGEVAAIDHVTSIESPYGNDTGAVSQDQRVAFATVRFDRRGNDLPASVGEQIIAAMRRQNGDGLHIELASQFEQSPVGSGPGTREGVALIAAVIILLITFGSAVAAGLPLVTAAFGLGIGLALIHLLARFVTLDVATPQLGMLIGIGAGIDYALLIVTRFRQGLRAGLGPEKATVTAVSTAGRAVLFAGGTVVISLMGILLIGLEFTRSMALGAIVIVLLVMLASVTLLPALLGVVRHGVNRWRLPFFRGNGNTPDGGLWLRWSHFVQRHPLPAALAALVVLVVLALPFFSMRLGMADAGTEGAAGTYLRAYELLAEGFGPGFSGPLLLAAEINSPIDASALERLRSTLEETEGVAFVAPSTLNPQRDAAVMMVFPDSAPDSARTEKLVHRLRGEVIPQALTGTQATVWVGGITAFNIDMSDAIARRLPWMVGAVVGVSFLLLMVVFRSLLIPLKAATMNLLSVGAAYGAMVAVFQWGWLKDVIGVEKTGPIDAFLPPFLFAILFGLSMDYEVFLLSRIREEYLRTGDNRSAVADGLAASARVITGAAAIMVTVFLSFAVIGDLRPIKMAGLGLATAIFVDATLVRMVLVPAAMELLGNANWWLPRRLDRILPRIGIEGNGDVSVGDSVGE